MGGLRNPRGIINSSIPVEAEIMEQNYAIEELMLQETGQQVFQAPIGLENEYESACKDPNFLNQFQHAYEQSWPPLQFDNDLSFEHDLGLLFGPIFDYESTLFEDHTNALGNALNWESSMCQMGGENPIGAGSSGLCSIGFHSLGPNIQQDENMLIDNDFDISYYLSHQSPQPYHGGSGN